MFKTRKGLLAIILLFMFMGGGLNWPDLKNFGIGDAQEIAISDNRVTHILYGDKSGGGHLYGTGKPCKSEFPKEWDADDVIEHVQSVAANENLAWKKQNNGYYTAEQTIDRTRMRVVLNSSKNDVITAYPVNTGRNPCPSPRAPANDNYND